MEDVNITAIMECAHVEVAFIYQVTDPDNKNYLQQTHTCQIVPSGDSSYFNVLQKVQLEVQRSIYYETTPMLNISVKCVDSGNPPLDIVKDFLFTVTDVNEPPTELTISGNTVSENSPNGTVVGILSSDDPEKAHQNFTYAIIGPPVVPFVLGGADGRTLMVSGAIDYEVTPYIDITVRVRDSGGLSLERQLRITVEDVNDPPTNIQVPNLNMTENSVENILISPVNVLDQDGNVRGCRLLDDAGGRIKLVGMNLVAGRTMTDFEAVPRPKTLTIKLNCSDTDNKSVSRSFAINVKDVNEPPSALELHSYQSSVLENKPDVEVGEISVQDPDIDQNHSCSVTGATNQLFTIREVNNKIVLKTINRGLDFEANIDHNVMVSVRCRDLVPSTQPQFSITREFRIDIKDENEVPTGRCSNKTLYIPYLASNGSIVGPLLASDPDNDEYYKKLTGKLKQSLSLTRVAMTAVLPFVVVDGNLVRSGAVEKNRKYVVSVRVKDNGFIVGDNLDGKPVFVRSPPKSSVFNCSIIIEGEDNYVKDILLEPNTVSQTARNGTIIGSLSTITQYPNETFTYKLLEQGQLPFAVIGTQLMVTASDLMNYQASMTPQVQVTISSYGSISGQIVKNFYIIIIDFNEKPANICLLHNTVKENQPANTTVGQILIEDPDYPYLTCLHGSTGDTVPHQADYSCQVVKGDDEFSSIVAAMFTVDSSLMLKTTMSLNYELFALVNGSVRVHVFCTDRVHPIRESLVVYITDGPDSPKDLQLVCCADVDCFAEEETNVFGGETLKQCQIVPDIIINTQPGRVIGYLKTRDEDNGDVFTFLLANVNSYFEVKPGHGNLPKAIGTLQLKNQNFTVSDDSTLKVYPVTITTEDQFQLSYTKTILLVNKDVCKDNNCVVTSSCNRHSNLQGYDCICPFGWRGNGLIDGTGCSECKAGQAGDRNNECHEINECLSNPCMNHGTCVDGTASYTCECVTGFTGQRCETNIDYCQDQPCKNKGVCEDQDKKFVCRCSQGFQGRTCDRQPSLCSECSDKEETMCVTFQDAEMRCLGPEYQIPIVNNQGVLSTDQLYEIESEIASLLDANVDSLMSRRRRSVSRFYVEVLQKPGKKRTDSQALLFLAALDIANMYKPLKASDACKALANTQYRCPSKSECKALANKGSSCPMGYASGQGSTPEPRLSSGMIAGIGVLVVIVIIILLVGAVFYYRRKYKHEKTNDDSRVHFNTADQEQINFSNPVYDTSSPRHRPTPQMDPDQVEDMLKDHLSKRELVIGNLDPSSVKKRNDVKVINNPTYLEPGATCDAAPTYEDIDNVKRASKASNDDMKCSRTLGKSFDGTASDPLYESLKKAKKPNQVKLAPEEDIDKLKAAAEGNNTKENGVESRYITTFPRKAVVKLPQYENLDQLKKATDHKETRNPDAKQGAKSRYENIDPTQTYNNWKECEDLDSLKAAIRADTESDRLTSDTAKEIQAPEATNPKVKDSKRKRSYGRQRSFGNSALRNPVYEALDSIPNMNFPDEESSRDRQGSIRAIENPRYETFNITNENEDSKV